MAKRETTFYFVRENLIRNSVATRPEKVLSLRKGQSRPAVADEDIKIETAENH
jgi:hypothetical protein